MMGSRTNTLGVRLQSAALKKKLATAEESSEKKDASVGLIREMPKLAEPTPILGMGPDDGKERETPPSSESKPSGEGIKLTGEGPAGEGIKLTGDGSNIQSENVMPQNPMPSETTSIGEGDHTQQKDGDMEQEVENGIVIENDEKVNNSVIDTLGGGAPKVDFSVLDKLNELEESGVIYGFGPLKKRKPRKTASSSETKKQDDSKKHDESKKQDDSKKQDPTNKKVVDVHKVFKKMFDKMTIGDKMRCLATVECLSGIKKHSF